MRHPRLIWLFIGILSFGLISHGTSVQASTPEESAVKITLEQIVQFEDTQGNEVLVEPGTYTIAAGEESLSLTNKDSNTVVTLEAAETSHDTEIPTPIAASTPGQAGPSAKAHVVSLFLPQGTVLQTIGTYPGIQRRGISEHNEIEGSTNTVSLEKAVHFIAPDGSPIVAEPGIYTAEVAQDWIRLIPGEERHRALLVEAQKGKNETEVEDVVAFSLPGATEKDLDLHHVMLLVPNGPSLEATGSYSGIQPRDIFKHLFRHIKKRVHRTVKHTKRHIRAAAIKRAKIIAKQARKNKAARQRALKLKQAALKAKKIAEQRALKLKQAALKAKRDAEHAARVAAATAKRIAQQVATGACKVALTTAQVAANVEAMILGPIKKELAKALQLPKAQKALHQAIAIIRQRQAGSIQRVIEAATILANPKNARTVKQLMNPNTMCERPEKTVRRTFRKLIGGPIRQALAVINHGNGSGVRTRGSFASASLALGGNVAKIGGGEIGVRYAFDFVNKSHWFLDLAGMVKSNVGGGGGVQLAIFPGKNPAQAGGWFLGAGVSFPLPKVPQALGGGLDFYFDFPLEIKAPFQLKWNLTSPKFFLDHFQGFGVSFGGGKNVSPADIALKIGGGVRLSKK